jgi:hypothetical protein
MKKNYSTYTYLIALSLAFAVGTASAQQQKGPGSSPQGEVSTTETEDLVYMREEEKLARDSYQVLAEQWGLVIFTNISKSEQRHMNALKVLLDGFGIVDPVIDESDIGSFVDPTLQTLFDDLMTSGSRSAMDALKVGGLIEETDILDIQEAIERAENVDIIATYENLLRGSRNHLRAFVGQIEFYGEIYTPVLMDPEELNAIVDFPMERGNGARKQGKGSGNGNGNGNGTCDGTGTCDGSSNGNGNGNGGNGNGNKGG